MEQKSLLEIWSAEFSVIEISSLLGGDYRVAHSEEYSVSPSQFFECNPIYFQW